MLPHFSPGRAPRFLCKVGLSSLGTDSLVNGVLCPLLPRHQAPSLALRVPPGPCLSLKLPSPSLQPGNAKDKGMVVWEIFLGLPRVLLCMRTTPRTAKFM